MNGEINMGKKGDSQSNASAKSAEELQNRISPLGEINLKKMFGGHGVFFEDKMFALVDKNGTIFFKTDDTIIKMFEDAGSEKHGRMPYHQVPDKVLSDEETLVKWAKSSITVAKNAG